jgi:(1->4)-alpha-D-glucan 1-alpha-D-glucosylmutase
LKVHGVQAERVCAFARHLGGDILLVAVPRLLDGLMGEQGRLPVGEAIWGDTWIELPPDRLRARWVNVLTEETIATQQSGEGSGLKLAHLFRAFPYGLLQADQTAPDRSIESGLL